MPADWKPAKRRQKDRDARSTKKHGKSYFGYKVAANVDKRYKSVRKIKVSTASEHGTTHFEDLVDPANTIRLVVVRNPQEDLGGLQTVTRTDDAERRRPVSAFCAG